jgi:hypothetical protein
MTGAVSGGASARNGSLAEIAHVAAEQPLVDPPVVGARKRHFCMLELDDGGDGLSAHVLNGVLVAEPIGAFDSVIHVPLPTIFAEIAQARGNTALRCDRMAAGRKHFRDARSRQPGLDRALRGPQPGAASSHHDHVEGVVDEFVCTR